MAEVKALLTVDRIAKSYTTPNGNIMPVLKDVSFSVKPGDTLAITGPSGSGKSTLLNIVGALDRPTFGRVCLGERDLALLSDDELASIRSREVGFVFQLHHLLPQCTALENVLIPTLPLGPQRDADAQAKRARKLLERVGLGNRMQYRPGQLSGGECQRVAVVRALVNKPSLILADEPTGSLDHETALSITGLLKSLNAEENTALIVVTHARELAGAMARELKLEDGKLNAAHRSTQPEETHP